MAFGAALSCAGGMGSGAACGAADDHQKKAKQETNVHINLGGDPNSKVYKISKGAAEIIGIPLPGLAGAKAATRGVRAASKVKGMLGLTRKLLQRRPIGASIRSSPGCNSFVAGTAVLMADGTHKNIEDVKVGDQVLATDPETGDTKAKPVLATITGKGEKNLVQITIDTRPHHRTTGKEPKNGKVKLPAKTGSKSGVIIATDAHPFWVAGDIDTWINATDLQPGMWLRTSAGTHVQVTALQRWTTPHQRVHNLTIADTHTYYVLAGATPVLAHNVDACKVSGPYHRVQSRSQSVDGLQEIADSGQVWGRTARGGGRPAVQAYPGPLPEGQIGVEFYTEATPSEWAWSSTGKSKPGLAYVQWHAGNDGVKLSADEEFAQINAIISRLNLE